MRTESFAERSKKPVALTALVIGPEHLDILAAKASTFMVGDWHCAVSGPAFPNRRKIEVFLNDPEHTVVGCHDAGDPQGFAIVRNVDAKVKWLIVAEGSAVAVARFLLVRIRNQSGLDPWGSVGHPRVRNALLGMAGMIADPTPNDAFRIRFTG